MDDIERIRESEMLALLFWVAAVLNIVAAIFFIIAPRIWQIMSLLEVIANKSIFAEAWGTIYPDVITLVLYITAVVFFIVAILDIICAYGASNGKDWTTPFGIAAATISLINFPMGTILSIIILAVIFWGVVQRNIEER